MAGGIAGQTNPGDGAKEMACFDGTLNITQRALESRTFGVLYFLPNLQSVAEQLRLGSIKNW